MRFIRHLASLRAWLAPALLVSLTILVCGSAAAQPGSLAVGAEPRYALEPALAVLEDPDRSLTLEQILQPAHQQQFAPLASHSGGGNFGLTQSAIWLRLNLQALPAAATSWQLEVA